MIEHQMKICKKIPAVLLCPTSFVQCFCLFLVILFVTGCVRTHSGSPESAQTVSGTAVSGQAVSGSDGASRYTYCSDRNLYYIREPYSDESRLIERDLESGEEREIPVDHIHEVCYADNDWVYDIWNGSENMFSEEDYDVSDVALCGGSIFLYDQSSDELVRIKLETGEKLTVAPFENYIAVSDEAVFCVSGDEDKEEIWQYSLAGQKSFCLISYAEFRELLGKRGLMDCSIGKKEHMFYCEGCFVRAGRLYVQIGIEGKGSGGVHCRNRVILSKETDKAEAALVYEEGLNECLANPEGRQKVFTKKHAGIYGRQPYKEKVYFKSRGFCVSMTEEDCLLYLENEDEKKNMPARYDFQTGRMDFLKKDDEWLKKHLYAANNRILTGDYGNFMEPYIICDKMPNNYDE